ncbi:MAG: metalloregulator ArsR/SmtB family transcription factor [Armatimonadota bacterium]|jgi:ArsR family transcriptional regulator
MDRALFRRQADICKALANAKRLELLHALRDGEQMVAELQRQTELPQTSVSQHLARLRAVGLVRRRQEGTNVFYALADPRIVDACDLVQGVLASHLADESELADRMSGAATAAAYTGT